MTATMMAQGYNNWDLRRSPRYSPPYEYSRPYREPYSREPRDRDIYYPQERYINREFERIERYDWRAPYRPY